MSKKDACYHKVKARYKVFPSAYASGAIAKCRKVGAANYGNKSKKKKDGGLMEAIDKVKKEDAVKMQDGGLTGGQKKLDKNKDGKISGEDFKLLRAEPMKLGGVVKMGAGGGVCRGMGAARAGGKFKIR